MGTGASELRSRGVRHGVQLEIPHRMGCPSGWRRTVGKKIWVQGKWRIGCGVHTGGACVEGETQEATHEVWGGDL